MVLQRMFCSCKYRLLRVTWLRAQKERDDASPSAANCWLHFLVSSAIKILDVPMAGKEADLHQGLGLDPLDALVLTGV